MENGVEEQELDVSHDGQIDTHETEGIELG